MLVATVISQLALTSKAEEKTTVRDVCSDLSTFRKKCGHINNPGYAKAMEMRLSFVLDWFRFSTLALAQPCR